MDKENLGVKTKFFFPEKLQLGQLHSLCFKMLVYFSTFHVKYGRNYSSHFSNYETQIKKKKII